VGWGGGLFVTSNDYDEKVVEVDSDSSREFDLENGCAPKKRHREEAAIKVSKVFALKLAWPLRAVLFLATCVSPVLALFGVANNDEAFSWLGILFYLFSAVAGISALASNPRAIGHWQGKAFVILTMCLIGSTSLFTGLVLKESADDITSLIGWFFLAFSSVQLTITPVLMLIAVKHANKVWSDQRIRVFIIFFLERCPKTLLSMLYISTTGIRAIVSTDTRPLLPTVGNPVVNVFLVDFFIFITFMMPIFVLMNDKKEAKAITVDHLALLNIDYQNCFELGMFGMAGVLSLLLFAAINEEGSSWDGGLMWLAIAQLTTVALLLVFEVFDKVVRPALRKVPKINPQPSPRSRHPPSPKGLGMFRLDLLTLDDNIPGSVG
jgi:hypothetical protein